MAPPAAAPRLSGDSGDDDCTKALSELEEINRTGTEPGNEGGIQQNAWSISVKEDSWIIAAISGLSRKEFVLTARREAS